MQNIGNFLSDDSSRDRNTMPSWLLLAFGVAGVVVLLGVIGFLIIQLDVVGSAFRTVSGFFNRSPEVKGDTIVANLPQGLGDKGTAAESEYSAVFLTNKQVYFGILEGFETETPVLKDVYYLRSQPRLQETAGMEEEQEGKNSVAPVMSDMTLIKLGSELHGPADAIQLNPDHILFIERLREDSRVVKAIKDFKSKQAK